MTACSQDNNALSGYIEGEYTYISSGVSGTLLTLNVKRGQTVKKDDLLFTLDPQPDEAAMESAKAKVGQMQAEVDFAKIQLARQKTLYAHNDTPKSVMDQAQTDYDSYIKQLQTMEQNVIQMQWAYEQKTVAAPISGYVNDTFFRVGEKVPANQPVLALLAPENIKVLFYIPEGQLSTIHLGQTIYFSCDGCNKQKIAAKISYISSEAEYTPPIIYSQGTRYKLVYLVRADIPADMITQFHPGQPVDIILHD